MHFVIARIFLRSANIAYPATPLYTVYRSPAVSCTGWLTGKTVQELHGGATPPLAQTLQTLGSASLSADLHHTCFRRI